MSKSLRLKSSRLTCLLFSLFFYCGLIISPVWADDLGLTSPMQLHTIEAGNFNTCGVRTDGTVTCWGHNWYGMSNPPVDTFTQVSTGYLHTCGIKTDGTVACWGAGKTNTGISPEYGQSIAPAGTFTQVSVGAAHTCGLKMDGTVACWGANQFGESTPPLGTFTQVSAGSGHTCGIKTDGTVVCWGDNSNGQSTPPVGTFTEVSAGYHQSHGVITDETVSCWGDNSYGQSQTVLRVNGTTTVAVYKSIWDAFDEAVSGNRIELMSALIYCQDAELSTGESITLRGG